MRLKETSEKSINNIGKQMKQSKGSIKENNLRKASSKHTILEQALCTRKAKNEWKHLSNLEKEVIIKDSTKGSKRTNNSLNEISNNTNNSLNEIGNNTNSSLHEINDKTNKINSTFNEVNKKQSTINITEESLFNFDDSSFNIPKKFNSSRVKKQLAKRQNAVVSSIDTKRMHPTTKQQIRSVSKKNKTLRKHGVNVKHGNIKDGKYKIQESDANSILVKKGNGITKNLAAFSYLKSMFEKAQAQQSQEGLQGVSGSQVISGASTTSKSVKMTMKIYRTTVRMVKAVIKQLSAAIKQLISFLATACPVIIPILLALLLIVPLVIILVGAAGAALESRPAGHGLPSFITNDMMEAFFEEQELNGIPVSSGVAQTIQESGFGSYGPGGESGNGLSKLAYEDKNLFGIKYWSGDSYAIGQNSWVTQEQTGNGMQTITAGFSKYPSYEACIKQRSVMLKGKRYWQHLEPYQNKNDGNYSVEYARKFVEGIKAGGWATSNEYVVSLINQMDTYDLYRFDNMNYEQFQNEFAEVHGEDYKNATAMQKHVVDAAYSTNFVGDGLCATWVSRVFNNAGLGYPGGNGNSFDMVTSSGDIKVGMVICVQHSGPSANSYRYGHIGIYIGDGKVMHNESSRTGNCSNGCTITNLDEWRATYEYQCTAYWGWVFGKDLSAM